MTPRRDMPMASTGAAGAPGFHAAVRGAFTRRPSSGLVPKEAALAVGCSFGEQAERFGVRRKGILVASHRAVRMLGPHRQGRSVRSARLQ